MSREQDRRLIEDYLPIEADNKEISRKKSVRLTTNEWYKAAQLGDIYWLYVVWNPLDNPDPEPLKIQSEWYCLAEIELEVETEESDEDEPDHYASWGQRRRVRTRTKDLELRLSVELVVEDQRIVAWTLQDIDMW